MGKPARHVPVKLIVGLIASQTSQFILVKNILKKRYGPIDNETGTIDFSCTDYYEEEMGKSLKRKFYSFEKTIPIENSHLIKLYTNKVEERFCFNHKRTVNIDPGYMTLANLILFTTKERSHRTYAGKGIYADLELQYRNRSFSPLEWTYPDYRTTEYIDFFNSVRTVYADQVREGQKLKAGILK